MWWTLAFFLGVALVVSLTFAFVAASTRTPRAIDVKEAYRFRRIVLLFLLVSLPAFLWVTLRRLPYPRAGIRPDVVVHVAARQFAFALSVSPITNSEEWSSHAASPPELPSGALIEFRVTSLDVNHGFGVYGPDGRLVAQIQAMPGYVNRLRVRLDPPGIYRILCLEYCGLAHHAMKAEVTVR